MTRREFVGAAAAPALLRTASPPNVILVITDDQGWWDAGIHGNPYIETPVMDRIAREGVRFSHFYCAPVCTPTRASLMTGRHYQRTGAIDTYKGRDTLAAGEITLAEIFRARGYRTACIGKWHLGRYMRYHPNERGFEHFFGFWQYGFINRYDDSDELWRDKRRVTTVGYITDVLTDQALAWLEQNKSKPFFLYLAYNAPHSPYLVLDPYIARYLKKGLPLQEARIYGMISSIDDNLGRLVAAMERWKLDGNTVLIFMSDNGGVSRFHTCGLRGAKTSVYEGGIRVPFFVRWPGHFPAGAVVGTPAQHVDLFATLCELVGAPLPADRKVDGRSFLEHLRRGEGPRLHDHLFHQWNRVRPLLDAPGDPMEAPEDERKMFRPNWAVQDARGFKLHATGELFDLARDPGERHDVAAQHPEVARELRRRFEEFFRDVTAGQDYRRVPIEVGREDENPVELDVAWAELAGKGLRHAGRRYHRDTIENWSEPGDAARWRIEVVAAGRYEAILEYGCAPASAGSRYQIAAGRARLESTVQPTAGPLVFESFRAGALELERGPALLEMRALSVRGGELMRLHRVWLRRVA